MKNHSLFQYNTPWLLLSALMATILMLTACAGTNQFTATSQQTTLKAYEDYKAAWNRHDTSAVVAYFQPNAALNNPVAGGPVSGQALSGWLQATFEAFPDFRVETVNSISPNDRTVIDQWVIKGTWTRPFTAGPLAGMEPSGRSFEVPGSGFYKWRNGKIVSGTHYMDQMALLTQIGVIAQN